MYNNNMVVFESDEGENVLKLWEGLVNQTNAI